MIRYTNEAPTPQQLSDLFRSSGIVRPADDPDRLSRMIQGANILITAWDQDQLVGIARGISDNSYCCYLSDLAVSAEYQKQGIGKRLVALVQEQLGPEVMLLLLSAASAVDYYPGLGFEKADNAFLIRRQK